MSTATIDSQKQLNSPRRHQVTSKGLTPVGDAWGPCVRALIRSLASADMTPEECRDPDAFLLAFARSWDQLRKAAEDISHVVEATYLVAADDRTTEKLIDIRSLAAREAAAILRNAPVLTGDCDRHIARAKALSPSDAYRYCATLLGQRAVQVIGRARYCFDALRDTGMAGSVTWKNRECSFTYPRCVVSDTETGRTESSTEKVEHEKGRLFNVTRHTVETLAERAIETQSTLCTVTQRILRPDIHPVPANDVPIPMRIKPLVAVTPPWLMPGIIVGEFLEANVVQEPLGTKTDQIIETSIRSSIERQVNWDTVAVVAGTVGMAGLMIAAFPFVVIGAAVYAGAHDPAFVVGGNGQQYCLAGWLPSELGYFQQRSVRRA